MSDINPDAFKLVLSQHGQHALPFADIILAQPMDPFLLWSLGEGESGWGRELSPPGPAGTGDGGHGRGLMQVDDRSFGEWLAQNDWTNPAVIIPKGVSIYLVGRASLATHFPNLTDDQLTHAALSTYNHGFGGVSRNIQLGRDVDFGTISNPPNRYGQNALDRAAAMKAHYDAATFVGPPAPASVA